MESYAYLEQTHVFNNKRRCAVYNDLRPCPIFSRSFAHDFPKSGTKKRMQLALPIETWSTFDLTPLNSLYLLVSDCPSSLCELKISGDLSRFWRIHSLWLTLATLILFPTVSCPLIGQAVSVHLEKTLLIGLGSNVMGQFSRRFPALIKCQSEHRFGGPTLYKPFLASLTFGHQQFCFHWPYYAQYGFCRLTLPAPLTLLLSVNSCEVLKFS